MDAETEQKIRHRAYELWIAAGKPEGSSLRFWKAAEAEIVAESQGSEGDDASSVSHGGSHD